MTDSLIGQVVREYEIRELIGSGGFGRVYRAAHRLLAVERALKVLHEHVAADAAVRRRFLEEARASDALRHEHIVRALEVFEHDDRLWIVMDYVAGRTLLQRLAEEGPLPVADALVLARAVASALDHAHGQGIVHCDLKPSNVLLRREDGAALLTDFGLARLQSERTESMWSVAGTLTYMSPEQLGLNGGAVDPRSDVYAFTALVYEMLSGQPPYGRGVESLAGHYGRLTPRPLGGRRDLPASVDGLLARGLHQDPGRRPQSAGALVRELDALVADEPTRPGSAAVVAPPRPQPAATAAVGRPPGRARAAAAGVAALLVAAVVPAATILPSAGTPFTMSSSRSVIGVAFSPDGRLVASQDSDSLQLWNLATGQPVGQQLADGDGMIVSIRFSPDDRILAAGDQAGHVWLWNPATGLPIGQPLVAHSDVVTGVAFSPDSSLLATGSADGTARLWNPATGQPIGQPLDSHTAVDSVAFSPDGRTLATGRDDGTVQLWDASAGRPVGRPFGGPDVGSIAALTFSPDGNILAGGSDDGSVRLWDPSTGRSIGRLPGDSGAVTALAFSADGRVLAGGSLQSDDGTVRLWDPDNGRATGRLTIGQGAVIALAFSPEGRLLASGIGGTSTWAPSR